MVAAAAEVVASCEVALGVELFGDDRHLFTDRLSGDERFDCFDEVPASPIEEASHEI